MKRKFLSSVALFVAMIIVALAVPLTVAQAVNKHYYCTIVIDAGHGGIDGGVVGRVTKIKESDINLAISKALKTLLVNAGIKVVMTRTGAGGLYGLPTKGFKKRDMQKRKEIIEKSSPDIVISIHQNFFSLPSKKGAQVFFDGENEQGKLLADSLQSSLNSVLGQDRSSLQGDYFILKCSSCASIIAECGFLSNREEEAKLVTAEYQNKIANIIFCGIIDYLSK